LISSRGIGATDPIFEAWIVGEIDSDEAIARIKALPRWAVATDDLRWTYRPQPS